MSFNFLFIGTIAVSSDELIFLFNGELEKFWWLLLVELDLSYNLLQVIPKEALKDCGYLMTLSLKGNPIRRVHQDTFDNLKVSCKHKCKSKAGKFWWIPELQRRSSKVFEKRALKSLLWVRNLYQSSTTQGLEPASIVHYTRPGSSIKRPTPN